MKLSKKLVEKPWGRTELPAMFGNTGGSRIGEIWFTANEELPLLVKYLFTSERLSVQVHPTDEQAHARGFDSGKEECWYIFDAEPGAAIGVGLKREVSADVLRDAAVDGSIEDLIDWRPVHPGDFLYVPAGTVHAIGGGVSLLEFQQNADVTFRLYDYGRPRELHLDDGVAVAQPVPYPPECTRHVEEAEEAVLINGPKFSLVQAINSDPLEGRRRWVMPLDGQVVCGGETASAGECLVVEAHQQLELGRGRILIGCQGAI